MDVFQTKKRGGVVRLAYKPHELVVVGSNPTSASMCIPKSIPNSIPTDACSNIICFSQHVKGTFRRRLFFASFKKIVIFLRPRICAQFAVQIAYVKRLKDSGRQHCVMNRVCVV